MTGTSLTDQLLAQLQGAPLQQIARQVGIDPSQAGSAVSSALPLLMGALGRNASSNEGADALFGALQRDHAGLDIGSVLGSVLGGGSGQSAGAAILGHVFGGQQSQAASGLGRATGLDGAQAGQLLAALAPLVMAFLSRHVSAQGLDAGALGQQLGQARQQAAQQPGLGGLLGSVLDQDGDGQLGVGDLIKLGSGLLGGGKR